MYYVTIGANNMVVIESYVKECASNGVVFDKVDFDAGVDAVYMYKG
ncbi:hypothetical protein RB43ORF091w [Escherichia phage RB43]|uniref:Uncharacterized protein n=1 Tax=Escherichia phage RB43 TaxID=2887182 RepID=Q56BV7_9CAUD|nr:hypothetical protein RB43ORF091w [Escherichia phage RB43]AAX78613.1 hypothetical protein RB43ORF091w [Escherichia phage RB43]